jgi:hypothetical protein
VGLRFQRVAEPSMKNGVERRTECCLSHPHGQDAEEGSYIYPPPSPTTNFSDTSFHPYYPAIQRQAT